MNGDPVTGTRRFVGDVLPPGTAHLVFVRSPYAHALIRSIDVATASRAEGVRLVLSGADLDRLGSIPSRIQLAGPDGGPMPTPEHPVLAHDRVRYVGEAVVAVVAETLALALEAAETVVVEYEELTCAPDIESALAPSAPNIHDEAPGNVCFVDEIGNRENTSRLLAEATHVTEVTMRVNRVTAAPIETRRALAVQEPGRIVLHAPVQNPHLLRDLLADQVLMCPRETLRVAVPAVGGGFGMKGSPHGEYAIVIAAAQMLGRPVYWEATRSEAMLCDHQGRDAISRVTLGFDGTRLTAIRWQLTGALGAYLAYNGAHTLVNNRWGVTGLYAAHATLVTSRGVFTNAPPIAPYRGAGRPEATLAIERALDVAAREMGVDPWVLRRRNLEPRAAFPKLTALGLRIDAADPLAALDALEASCDRAGFPARRAQAQTRGLLRGLGVAHFLEIAGGPPGRPQPEGLRLDLVGPRDILVAAGTVDCGQNHAGLVTHVVRELLGPVELDVRFQSGDTDLTSDGVGTFGSRSAMVLSHLLARGSRTLLARLESTASHLLDTSPEDVEYDSVAGMFRRPGTNLTATFQEVAARHLAEEGPMTVELFEAPDDASCPNGLHAAEVEIDPETGTLVLCAYHAVDDVGHPLDTTGIAAQIHGGVAQGFGQAVLEAVRLDPATGQPASGSFMDYALPRASDLCGISVEEIGVPTDGNAFGIKGVGEAGAVAALSAVANAVHDALAGAGNRHIDPPYTPARLWSAMEEARRGLPEDRIPGRGQ